MRNKILTKGHHLALVTIIVLSISPKNLHAQIPSVEAQLSEFIYSDEFKAPEIAKLRKLPKESVTVLSRILNEKGVGEAGELRVYKCLATKFLQHEHELSKIEHDIATKALLDKLTSSSLADRSFRVNALKGVRSPELFRAIQEVSHSLPKTETLRLIDEPTPVNTLAISSPKQATSPPTHIPNQKMDFTAPITPSQSPEDTRFMHWPGMIGAILLLAIACGTLVKIRRKK